MYNHCEPTAIRTERAKTLQANDWLERFEHLVSQAEDEINLAEATLVIAADEYPELDVAEYLARIDALATLVQPRINRALGTREKIVALNRFLFEELHFAGNREFYYDPRNSYLNDVLNRRVGLPITLSVLYIEIARRVGLPIHGVGLPGHFLVKYRQGNDEIFIDPFNEGQILDEKGLGRLLGNLYAGPLYRQRDWLDAVGPRYILERLLTNLKNIFVSSENYERALPVAEKLLRLAPRSEEYLRDAGMLSLRAGFYQRAAWLLEEYLLQHPEAPAALHVRIYLRSAWTALTRLN